MLIKAGKSRIGEWRHRCLNSIQIAPRNFIRRAPVAALLQSSAEHRGVFFVQIKDAQVVECDCRTAGLQEVRQRTCVVSGL